MAKNKNTLPHGWHYTTIGDTCQIIMGQSPDSSSYNNDGVGLPFFQGKSEFGDIYPSVVKWCSEPNKVAEAEDILISVRAPVGPTNLAYERSAIGRGLAALRPELNMPSKFFLYQLRHLEEQIANKGTGTTFAAIKKAILESQSIVIAPLAEQKRIVEEIEAQFSRLDSWLDIMYKLRDELPRLRASILKAAVEGRLVPQNPDDEPADILLQRILDERRRQWEENYLAELEAKGKPSPKDDKWKEKYKEPESPNLDVLPELPSGWVWASVSQLGAIGEQTTVLTGPFGSNLGRDDFVNRGVPVLTIGCLTEQGINLDNAQYVTSEKANELHRYRVQEGDLLFSRMASVGRVGFITQSLVGAIINYHIMRLRLESHGIKPEYFVYFVTGSKIVSDYLLIVNHGATRPGINTQQLLGLPVALPPIKEQYRISDDINSRLSVISELRMLIEDNIKRAEKMRQSVLKQAFEGKLVEQDSDDEPASELLERIRIERERRAEEQKNNPKPKGKKREAKVTTKTERKSLYDTLKEAEHALQVDELFRLAGFSPETIDDFYEQLRKIEDMVEFLQQNDYDVLVKVKS